MLGSGCYAQAAVPSRVTNNVCCGFKNGWTLVRFAKRKCNTADNGTKVVSAEVLRKHLKVLKRGDAKDVISWCYAQWCDGLAMLEIVDVCGELLRGSREKYSISRELEQQCSRVSESAKRDGRVRRMGKQGLCICRPIRQDNTTSIRRLSISYWIGQ